MTLVLPAAGSPEAASAGDAGCCGSGRFMPASAERPRTSAGEGGDVGGGTAGTLGEGLRELRSARFLRRRTTTAKNTAAACVCNFRSGSHFHIKRSLDNLLLLGHETAAAYQSYKQVHVAIARYRDMFQHR